MFTPPPSPTPTRTSHRPSSPEASVDVARMLFRDASPSRPPSPPSSSSSSMTLAPASTPSPPPPHRGPLLPHCDSLRPTADAKKSIGRRTTWTIIVVPVVLLIITFSTRYLTHPAVFDVLASDQHFSWTEISSWQPHKRHPEPDPQSPSGISFPTPTSSSAPSSSSSSPTATIPVGSQPIPTVPAAAPVLPTPFPQPYDTSLSQNFSTQGCKNFFVNMTQTTPFRECRPFSLLQRSSSAFLQAQSNLSALNTIVWGTCNTDADRTTCNNNMAWFRDNMQTQCSQELSANNVMVTNALRGLQAYSLMRDAACVVDPTTNAYCYVEAVRNSNPSDLYFYQLPLGIGLPTNTVPSCSSCTKSIMQLYATAGNLTALVSTYNTAARIADGSCGSGYVQQTTLAGSATGLKVASVWTLGLVSLAIVMFSW